MNRIKTVIRKILARRKVRILLLVAHAPIAWVVIRAYRLFDNEWYRMQYSGDRLSRYQQMYPLLHYLLVGRQKGLTPSPFFIGEHYDPGRWHLSIIDPLFKYVTRKKSWGRATSLLFDGSRYARRGRITSPLANYLRELRQNPDSIPVYFDTRLSVDINKKWSDVKNEIYARVIERTEQHKIREIAAPVAHFDETKERTTIEECENFDMEKAGLVSIVMPAWNREVLIKDAIESVQNQTYENWELLIVDDGSTDRTVETVKSYADNDARVKLFTPPHGGVSRARNHAIEQAKGEWIAFLDSDNTWTPNFLLASLATLAKEKKNAASYSAIKMDSNGQIRYRVTEPNTMLLETGNFIDLNALIVKKSLLDRVGYFDEKLRRMVDYDLVCRISKVTDFVYVPVIGVNYINHDDLDRISTTESISWDGVVKSKNFIDWEMAPKMRPHDSVSIVVPVRGAISSAVLAVTHILKNTPDHDVEIIIADASSSSAMNIAMTTFQSIDQRVRYHREPACRDVVFAANYGFIRSRGESIVVVNQHVVVEPGWLAPLLEGVDDNTLCGPLQLQKSRTIRSAGVEYFGDNSLPVNILENHPLSDITELDERYDVDGLMNGCFAVSAKTFAQLQGLNPLYDGGFELQDLCHRLKQQSEKTSIMIAKESMVINPDGGRGWYGAAQRQYVQDWAGKVESRISHSWGKAGFVFVEYVPVHPQKDDLSMVRPVLEPKQSKGSYRWAIKISAPADERRFAWGDLYYAEALADALSRLGQRVAIDYHDYHERPTSYLDDIILDLRGLDNTKPQAGKLNIMWVISHPDDVTVDMVRSFDIVYAAGKVWAEDMGRRADKDVNFLPQCTDTNRFYPLPRKNKSFAGKVLFVGNSRGVMRPIVSDAIVAGLDVAVYGGGWDGLIDKKYIKGTFIPNDKLAIAYSAAEVVLNDHWEDMRKWGFLSNRLFDIAATGSCIATDNVEGLYDVFDPSYVRTYKSANDLAEETSGFGSSQLTQKKRQEIHKFIRDNHSFDARAKELLEAVRPRLK